MHLFLFYFSALIAVLSALGVILMRRPTRALLTLIVTMFALSIIYLMLGAPFVAMVHLIVYAGAVLILFLFVIMLQGVGASEVPLLQRFPLRQTILAGLAGTSFAALLVSVLRRVPDLKAAAEVTGTVEAVGQVLFRDYLIPFELTSVLLLVGIFAAVSLAKKEKTA